MASPIVEVEVVCQETTIEVVKKSPSKLHGKILVGKLCQRRDKETKIKY
jgi:hypothetical protein